LYSPGDKTVLDEGLDFMITYSCKYGCNTLSINYLPNLTQLGNKGYASRLVNAAEIYT